jgi:hypothetical protein
MRQAPLTIDEHLELGNALNDVREAISRVLMRLPSSSKQSRRARRVINAIDDFRSVMDDQLCKQVPEALDPRKLTLQVYFSRSRLKRGTLNTNDHDVADAFKDWCRVT